MKSLNLFSGFFLCLLSLALVIQICGCGDQNMNKTIIVKQADGQLSLAVVVKAKEGHEETVKNACIALLEPTRKEKGCINYALHMDPNDNGRFMFYENWESKELWDIHLNQPHIKAFGDNIGPLLAEPLDLTNWKLYD
jgi:quinol monooxygenase YgiN